MTSTAPQSVPSAGKKYLTWPEWFSAGRARRHEMLLACRDFVLSGRMGNGTPWRSGHRPNERCSLVTLGASQSSGGETLPLPHPEDELHPTESSPNLPCQEKEAGATSTFAPTFLLELRVRHAQALLGGLRRIREEMSQNFSNTDLQLPSSEYYAMNIMIALLEEKLAEGAQEK
jgi:hypothetical protein